MEHILTACLKQATKMSIQIASADETKIEDFYFASLIHKDESKILLLLNAEHISEDQKVMLETDGLFVGLILGDPMIKTKTQYIRSTESYNALESGQWIIEFEL